ncbi:MAG: hypothetical protein ACO1QR_15725 [Chthoniobacteraceae bacterium]
MNGEYQQPDFDSSIYHCCGSQELMSFACPQCHRHMIICNECDTLFANPNEDRQFEGPMNLSNCQQPMFLCPHCGNAIRSDFRRDPAYHFLPI